MAPWPLSVHWSHQVTGWVGLHLLGNRLAWWALSKSSPNFKSLSDATQEGAACRVVSSVHALAATALSAWMLLTEDLAAKPMYAQSAVMPSLINFSVGYMLADLANETRCWLRGINYDVDLLSVIHHVFVIGTGALYHCAEPTMYNYVVALGLATEVSTPLVNARWFAVELKHGSAMYQNGLGFLMMAVFATMRVPLCITALGSGYANRDVIAGSIAAGGVGAAYSCYVWLSVSGLSALNGYWFSLMARGAIDAVRGAPAMLSDGTRPKKES